MGKRAAVVDPLGHQTLTLADAWGRVAYVQQFTGSSGATYAVYATTRSTYDLNGKVVSVVQPNGVSTNTTSYDAAGRTTSSFDADRGTTSYSYDANGNLTASVDARGGGAGTVYSGYDALNRPLWHGPHSDGTNALAQYTYDTAPNGKGLVASESFTGTGGLTGSYAYTYDQRGRQTQVVTTLNGTPYTTTTSYDDLNEVTQQGYPDGQTVTTTWGQSRFLGLQTQPSGQGSPTTLVSGVKYNGQDPSPPAPPGTPEPGGPAGQITTMTLGAGSGVYTYGAKYDAALRLTDRTLTRISDSTLLFEASRAYDAAGNVGNAWSRVPQGTDTQAFCYDALNRLVWASAVATPTCSGPSMSAGSLTSAQYTQTFSYDNLNRLVSLGGSSYLYGDAAHLHAATSTTAYASYTYDAAGDMTCRAPNSGTVCGGGSPTGAQLGYDIQGQLATWQNAPSSPTTTAKYLYDGEGQRVEQQVTASGTTTTTLYLSNLEEVAITGGTTINTAYFYANGQRIALAVNGAISYLGDDGLGSATTTLDASGNGQASELYLPYGGGRYTSGTMPTRRLFTGQVSDAATSGLDYYNARSYDPALGQFASPDPAGDGLNLYAYVKNDPTTLTDPTGLFTFGICVGGSAGLGIGGFVQGCVAVGYSTNAGWSGGLTGTVGGGGYAGIGAEGGIEGQVTNADTVDDLGKQFTYLGAGGDLLGGVGGTGFVGSSKGHTIWGIGAGPSGGADIHISGGESYTWTVDFSTIGHWAPLMTDAAKTVLGQQAHEAKQWAVWQTVKAERWVSQRWQDAQNWASQQASNAASWVIVQENNASNWASQQINNTTQWIHQWIGWP